MLSNALSSITGSLLLVLLATASTGANSARNPGPAPVAVVKTTLAKPIDVVGIAIRTTNAAEAGGHGEIPKLWARFFKQNLGAQIPHRIGKSMIVVYSGYTSDEKREYDYLLGVPVDPIEVLPKGLSARGIPAGRYAVITTPRGRPQNVVPATWRKIWKMPESELGSMNSLAVEYETYDDFTDPNHMQVSIHLGLIPKPR